MGEATSFMLPRFDATLKPELTGLAHPVSTYLRQNLHYTFANFNDEATYANLVAQVGVGRVAFSADYRSGRCVPPATSSTSCRCPTTREPRSVTVMPNSCWACDTAERTNPYGRDNTLPSTVFRKRVTAVTRVDACVV